MKLISTFLAMWQQASFHRRLGIIVGAGLALRLIWAAIIPIIPLSDSNIYWVTANNIATHGVYGIEVEKPFSYWAVGTSGYYAFFFKLFGVHNASALLANLISGIVLIITTALLAKRWFNETVALWAGAAIAFWPTLIMFTTVMASEIVFAAAVNLALLAWGMRRPSFILCALLAGILFGAATLIRPVAMLIPIIMAVIYAVRQRSILPNALRLGLVVLAMAVVIAPWTARNMALHGEFVLVSTNGGPVMWMGNHEGTTGNYTKLPAWTEEVSEIERAHRLSAEAKQYMLENPGQTFVMFFRKLFNMHIRETIAVHWNMSGIDQKLGAGAIMPMKLLTQSHWMLLLAVSLVGIGLTVRRALEKAPLIDQFTVALSPPLMLWGYYAGVHAIIIGDDRYHLQSVSFVAMFAALAIVTFFNKRNGIKADLTAFSV